MTYTAAYIRVSTTKQLDGNGPQQQRDAIIAYAVANGREINDWFTDDETGMTAEREKVQRLLELAREGKLTTLVVDRMDRLGRTLLVCEALYKEFIDAGVEVVFASQTFGEGATGTLVRQIMSSISEYQRTEWLVRMRASKAAKAVNRGTYAGSVAPFGYKLSRQPGVLAIDDAEALIVRRIFAYHQNGATQSAIARTLNSHGYKTRGGSQFAPVNIFRILGAEAQYRALAPFGKTQLAAGVEPAHPAILEGPQSMNGKIEQNARVS